MTKLRGWTSFPKLWNRYKYRFVPWIMLNSKLTQPSNEAEGKAKVDIRPQITVSKFPEVAKTNTLQKDPFDIHHVSLKDDRRMSDHSLTKTLSLLLNEFKTYETNLNRNYSNQADEYFKNLKIMHDVLGFSIRTGSSRASPDAGLGVFVASGTAKAGSIVGLYPGTIYRAFEPLFFPSINNSFIFRCSDGIHVDGKSRGLSRAIYKSCAGRDKFNLMTPCCDGSWLTLYPSNPLNTGQYVNNKGGIDSHNVVYQECFLPLPSENLQSSPSLAASLWKYLPNVWSNPANNNGLKIIPLVAVRDIHEGEELFSSYFTVVHS